MKARRPGHPQVGPASGQIAADRVLFPLEPAAVRARQRRAYQLEPLRRVRTGHPFGHALHAGFGEVRPSYGLVLVPLYERDGLRMGELARQAHTGKQTMTELVRRLERDGLVERRPAPATPGRG